MMNEIMKTQLNNYYNPLLQYNPMLYNSVSHPFMNRISQDTSGNDQKERFDQNVYNLFNFQQMQQNNMFGYNPFNAMNNSTLYNNNNNLLSSLSLLNNNYPGSINSNLINNFQNNIYSNSLLNQYLVKNSIIENTNKTTSVHNDVLINHQKFKNNNDINKVKAKKSNSLNQESALLKINVKVEKEEKPKQQKKVFLRKKTKKPASELEEDEEDDKSSSKSRISEKNSTSSTVTLSKKLHQKKNTRNLIKYEENNLMLGTKEEYEKFFKNDLNFNEYSERDKNLIDLINNPRRKKKKIQEVSLNDYCKIPLNLKHNEEFKAYIPHYQADLEKTKSDKYHLFMSNNFPDMYNINNFYLFTKKNLERKKELVERKLIVDFEQIKSNTKEKENKDLCLKNVWKNEENDTDLVADYLFEVEKVWPNEDYKFSQELSLELLMLKDYNTSYSINLIKSKDNIFKDMIKARNVPKIKND